MGDGERGQHPGDPKLGVHNVANCRCFMTPKLLDEPRATTDKIQIDPALKDVQASELL